MPYARPASPPPPMPSPELKPVPLPTPPVHSRSRKPGRRAGSHPNSPRTESSLLLGSPLLPSSSNSTLYNSRSCDAINPRTRRHSLDKNATPLEPAHTRHRIRPVASSSRLRPGSAPSPTTPTFPPELFIGQPIVKSRSHSPILSPSEPVTSALLSQLQEAPRSPRLVAAPPAAPVPSFAMGSDDKKSSLDPSLTQTHRVVLPQLGNAPVSPPKSRKSGRISSLKEGSAGITILRFFNFRNDHHREQSRSSDLETVL
jgi:hypothetical protein